MHPHISGKARNELLIHRIAVLCIKRTNNTYLLNVNVKTPLVKGADEGDGFGAVSSTTQEGSVPKHLW